MYNLEEIKNTIIEGDCVEVLKTFPENSVDAIVTDPPYGLEFMGKEWDSPWKGKASKEFNTSCDGKLGGFKKLPNHSRVNNIQCKKCGHWKFSGSPCKCEKPDFPNARLIAMKGFQDFTFKWAKECLRVLKPGGHLLSFGGARTYHRMACAIEDAGFEIREMIEWIYGQGFPKSLAIDKSIAKREGAKREGAKREGAGTQGNTFPLKKDYQELTETENSKKFEGLGTALKPAHEPICMARKPISEPTIAENCIKWGTGGLSIDECRIGVESISVHNAPKGTFAGGEENRGSDTESYRNHQGRFPANLITDGSPEVVALFPNSKAGKNKKQKGIGGIFNKGTNLPIGYEYGDNGSASRFFYQVKPSRAERNMGCEGLEDKPAGMAMRDDEFTRNHMGNTPANEREPVKNNHPTVKSISLMQYLIKLVSREGQIILDPFAGSGSTLIAAKQLKRNYIGIEKEVDYIKIAEARLKSLPQTLPF